MLLNDFLALPEEDLMSFWIKDQVKNIDHPDVQDFAEALFSYEAYGRAGASQILAEAGYTTDEPLVKIISLAKAKELLTRMRNKNDFTIFTVDFIKRTTGELRKMVCRFGVTSALQGGEKSFKDSDHDLKTVFDMQKQAYRSIALESIIRMRIHGQKYLIEENKAIADRLED